MPLEPDRGPTTASGGINPVTLSVLLNRFVAVAREMTLTLEHTAWTSILALGHDFSCAIYDGQRRQIAMHEALPLHTSAMHVTIAEIAERHAGDIHDGDVFLTNDPYAGNTHIGDLVTACPVFAQERLAFWVVTKGHQLDCGAFVPSSVTSASRNVWQEGITIPPVKLYDRGEQRADVLEIYLSNVRYRDLLLGDLQAQLGSIWTGRDRVAEICDQYGLDEVQRYVDEMIGYAARRTSTAIAGMPDGRYEAEGWIDGDGIDGVDLPIRVAVEIAGSTVSVDYAGSAPQGAGGTNGTLATLTAAGTIPVIMCLDPDIPHNQGCLDHVTVTAERGSICWAEHPASTSAATLVPSDMMQDVVQKALAQAVPDLVVGGTARGANIPGFAGVDSATGEPWGAMLFNNLGGGGASRDADGWPMIGTIGAWGGLKALSIEQVELLYPLLVERWEIEPDSGGIGRSVGGPGNRLVVRPLRGAIHVVEFGDGRRNPPHGVLGGDHGSGGGAYVEPRAERARTFVSAGGEVRVAEGERWVGVSTGGGGYGDPLERDPEAVALDVREGLVSDRAAERFGVVLTDERTVDRAATDRLRSRLRTTRGALPQVTPSVPDASRWLVEQMRDDDVYVQNPTVN